MNHNTTPSDLNESLTTFVAALTGLARCPGIVALAFHVIRKARRAKQNLARQPAGGQLPGQLWAGCNTRGRQYSAPVQRGELLAMHLPLRRLRL